MSGGLLSGCSGDDGPSQEPLARVDVVTAKVVDFAPRVTLTGTIQAQVQNDLSFRLSGKIIERNVDVGDHVTADQILARLDPRIIVGTVLTLVFLPALYVAWYRIEAPEESTAAARA